MPKFKPNAYGEFVSEFRKNKIRDENKTYPTFESASLEAAPLWELLPADEKERYREMASNRRGDDTTSGNKKGFKSGQKKTSQGKLLSEVHRLDHLAKTKVLMRQKYVERRIKSAKEDGVLGSQVFYLIHSTPYIEDDKNYYHAELGIAKFSLDDGITDSLHLFIQHENLPTGYIHDARDRCEREHRIPLPPRDNFDLDPVNYEVAYFRVRDFLTTDPNDGEYHIFSVEEQTKITENFFVRCSQQIKDEFIPQHYLVHDFADLFMNLMRLAHPERNEYLCKSMIKSIISGDRHDMLRSLACVYHFEWDALPACSLSRARRWAHYVCEECCNCLGIYMESKKHFPEEVHICQEIAKIPKTVKPAEKDKTKTTEEASGSSTIFDQPLASFQEKLLTSLQDQPLASLQEKPLSSFQEKPLTSFHEKPLTSFQDQLLTSLQDQLLTNVVQNGSNKSGSTNRATVQNNQNHPPRSSARESAWITVSGRNGATASATRLTRGGGNHANRAPTPPEPESDDNIQQYYPHDNIAYLHARRAMNNNLTADDVDPVIPVPPERALQNLDINNSNPPSRNRFPKRRGKLAANFDLKMD